MEKSHKNGDDPLTHLERYEICQRLCAHFEMGNLNNWAIKAGGKNGNFFSNLKRGDTKQLSSEKTEKLAAVAGFSVSEFSNPAWLDPAYAPPKPMGNVVIKFGLDRGRIWEKSSVRSAPPKRNEGQASSESNGPPQLPIYSSFRGPRGGWIMNHETRSFMTIPATVAHVERPYAFYMQGTEMDPKVSENALLFPDPDGELRPHNIVIVWLKGLESEYLVREFISQTGATVTLRKYGLGIVPEDKTYDRADINEMMPLFVR